MALSPDILKKQAAFTAELRHRVEAAQAVGLPEPLLANLLLDLSIETAMHGDPQDMFDHFLLLRAEGARLLEEFDERLRDKLDPAAYAEGIIRPHDGAA